MTDFSALIPAAWEVRDRAYAPYSKFHVGAALLETDGGYVGRVLLEQAHMRNVAEGRNVPANATNFPVAPASKEAEAPTLNDKPEVTEQVALLR